MPNDLYKIAAGSTTGTLGAYTAFTSEQTIEREWQNVWLRETALLAMIHSGKANWNKGSLQKGNMMLIPVLLTDMTTVADGIADGSVGGTCETTAITPHVTTGFTQAQFNIAHYRATMILLDSETRLIKGDRGNLMGGKTAQLMASFKNAIADDLGSASADSRTAVLGVRQPLATGNTVGGLAQGTDTDWQASVQASAGAFTLDLIDDRIDSVAPRGGKTDLILLGWTTSLNLFGKLRAAISDAERLVNINFKAKYGIMNIEYLDAICVSDNRLGSGIIAGLDASTWYYRGDERPQLVSTDRLPGTDAYEHFYNMWAGIGINNPAKNWLISGVS